MRPLYVSVQGEPVLCLLHPAREPTGPAVLFCPPFGREDATSYRSRLEWAEQLAGAGMPVLRFDLPGTGDSGGRITDPHRLESWIETVSTLARFLRVETGASRIAAIGIGLGGLLAVTAAAEGAALDDLVLWGVPAHGRALARELTTFARIESDSIVAAGAPEPPAGAAEEIAPGGFLLPTEIVDALRHLDLTALRLPHHDTRRALLLDRDGIAPHQGLRSTLEESGAQVETADGHGYAEMMTVFPERARLPNAVAGEVIAWLLAAPRAPVPAVPNGRAVPASATTEIAAAARVRETPLEVAHAGRRLFGILTEPIDAPPADLALVLLNAGAIRRSGPSRMWVTLARRWAGQGLPTCRVDLAGIGDASAAAVPHLSVPDLYDARYVEQVRAAIDAVATHTGARRFALLGLCAGAYWGFHTALVDERVSLVTMLNPRLLFWDPAILDEHHARNRRSRLFKRSAWRELRTARLRAVPQRALTVATRLATEPLRHHAHRDAHRKVRTATDTAFDRLAASDIRVVLAFSDGEPLRADLVAAGILGAGDRWPQIELVDLPGRDHILRPLWMHEHVHETIDRVLAAELRRPVRDERR